MLITRRRASRGIRDQSEIVFLRLRSFYKKKKQKKKKKKWQPLLRVTPPIVSASFRKRPPIWHQVRTCYLRASVSNDETDTRLLFLSPARSLCVPLRVNRRSFASLIATPITHSVRRNQDDDSVPVRRVIAREPNLSGGVSVPRGLSLSLSLSLFREIRRGEFLRDISVDRE